MKSSLFSLFLTLACVQVAPAAKPNVILFMCDDLGWGDVGFNGSKVIKTPHLDAMAAGGMNFTRFYSGSSVCSPTRASCLTGRHPFRVGVPGANTGHMPPEEITLAEFLREEGYKTGHFGKWHLGTLTKTVKDANRGGPKNADHFSPPQINGFDVCFATESKVPTWDPMLIRRDPESRGKWWTAVEEESEADFYGTRYWDEKGEIVEENLRGDDTRVIVDRGSEFIRTSVESDKPFFTVIWTHAPHLPVVTGGKYEEMYAHVENGYERSFYGCVTAVDEQVGRVRALLRELKVEGDTMFWFCSDNGPEGSASGAPGRANPFRGRKRNLYEGGVRVPGLLEWPGNIPTGGKTDFPVVTSDYFPTIAAVLGKALPERVYDGINVMPAIVGEQKEREKKITFLYGGNASLVSHRYKLIREGAGKRKRATGDADYELYDLIADPSETKNLVKEKSDVVTAMKAELEAMEVELRSLGKPGGK